MKKKNLSNNFLKRWKIFQFELPIIIIILYNYKCYRPLFIIQNFITCLQRANFAKALAFSLSNFSLSTLSPTAKISFRQPYVTLRTNKITSKK